MGAQQASQLWNWPIGCESGGRGLNWSWAFCIKSIQLNFLSTFSFIKKGKLQKLIALKGLQF